MATQRSKRARRRATPRRARRQKPEPAVWTQHGKPLTGTGAELIEVEDAFGHTHTVPRAALPEPPPKGATVVNLAGPDAADLLSWLGPATGKPTALRRHGALTLTNGDLAHLAVMRRFFRVTQRAVQRKGGTADKHSPGIWQRVLDLVRGNPKITVGEAWRSFPEHRPGDTDTLIYRDGNRLVEVDDRTGRERPITYDTFRGYLKAARKILA